jgi:hypothetical protein
VSIRQIRADQVSGIFAGKVGLAIIGVVIFGLVAVDVASQALQVHLSQDGATRTLVRLDNSAILS